MITFLRDQFKSFNIQYYIGHSYDPKYYVHSRLLTQLISNSSHAFPSRQLFHEHLETLYGLTFNARFNVMGFHSVFKFEIKGVHGQFVSEDTLLMNSVRVCMDSILNPRFDRTIFDEEVYSMLQQLYSIKENKRSYASYRFKHTLDASKTRGMSIEEQVDVLKSITLQDVQTYFNDFIVGANRIVIGTGPFTDFDMNDLQTYFKPLIKGSIHLEYDPIMYQVKEPLKETLPMQQKMIYQAYHIGILPTDKLYYPMLIFNEILGSSADSRLFREIRENQGLCYQVYSAYNPFDTTLTIYTGIDIQKEIPALHAIDLVLSSMSNVSEDELDFAKKTLTHQITSMMDQQNYPLDALMRKAFYQTETTYEIRLERILQTTFDDLYDIKSKIKPMYTYILTGEIDA